MNRIAILLVVIFGMAGSVFAQQIPNVPFKALRDNAIVSIAWKPDGLEYAAVNNNGTIRIFDVVLDEPVIEIVADNPNIMMDAAWNFDGTFFAFTDGEILEIWDANTWQLLHSLLGHSFPIWGISWNPNDNRIVSVAYAGQPFNFRIWDAEAGHEISVPKTYGHITSVVWSLHEQDVIFTTGGASIQRWADIHNDSNGEYLFLENTLSGELVDLAIHPSENWVAMVGSGDPEIWDIENQTLVQSFEGHVINYIDEFVFTAEFNPSGEMIATAGTDKTVRIWDVETGEQLDIIEAGDYVYALAFSPDGTRLAYGGVDGLYMFALNDED